MFKHLIIAAALAASPAAFAQDHSDHAEHNHDGHDHENHDHSGQDHAEHETRQGHGSGSHTAHHETAAKLSHTAEIDAALAAGGTPVVVEVLGAVCDFCAKAMNKSFGRRDEVAAVYVDLDEKTLNLVLAADQSMDDAEIRKVVKRAGYKAKTIHRDGLTGS